VNACPDIYSTLMNGFLRFSERIMKYNNFILYGPGRIVLAGLLWARICRAYATAHFLKWESSETCVDSDSVGCATV
jgi:hypothetical protein